MGSGRRAVLVSLPVWFFRRFFRRWIGLLIVMLSGVVGSRSEAEVFWPRSGAGGESGGGYAPGALPGILGGRVVWSEPLVVNGMPVKLTVTVPELPLWDCLAILRRDFPLAVFRIGPDGIMVR
ncbi:MAG: hypothetical protein PHQ27_05990, partial [Victivallales bacterium]|nr:hypothetical protein [Victivallales bacterium]